LAERKARVSAPESGAVAPQNQWAALRAALRMVDKKPKSQILVYLYNHARTYFSKNV